MWDSPIYVPPWTEDWMSLLTWVTWYDPPRLRVEITIETKLPWQAEQYSLASPTLEQSLSQIPFSGSIYFQSGHSGSILAIWVQSKSQYQMYLSIENGSWILSIYDIGTLRHCVLYKGFSRAPLVKRELSDQVRHAARGNPSYISKSIHII